MSLEKDSNVIQMAEDSSIVTSTIYKLNIPGEYSEKYSYGRYGNPTRDALESALADLENANFALTYSSKTAAGLALLSTIKPNELVIFSDVLSCDKFKNLGYNAKHLNCDDIKSFESSLNTSAKIVWIETQTILTVVDIKKVAAIVNSKTKAILVVDNSLLTPCLLQPLKLGADVVVYTLGEFIGGHGDISAGALTTNDQELHKKLKYQQYSAGAVPSTFDCYLINRSLKTLLIRMRTHQKNALAVAQFLREHPKIQKVFYPSSRCANLDDNAQIYSSGIISFHIKGSLEEAKAFLNKLETICISENIEGVESSASIPWAMSHSHLPEKQRLEVGVTSNLVRLSVGIEETNALIADIEQALEKITNTFPGSHVIHEDEQ